MRVTRRAVVATTIVGACSGRYPGSRDRRAGGRVSIVLRGSDTMVLLGRRWAEAYARETQCDVEVAGGGSGTGIAALINATTDLAMSSRRIHTNERLAIEATGRALVERTVATDAVVVYVHRECRVSSMALTQLAAIYRGLSRRWEAFDGRPNAIVTYGRESSSGTYAFFKEKVLRSLDFAAEVQSLPGTASVIETVSDDPPSIGYAGLSAHSTARMLALHQSEHERAYEPTIEHVMNGEYPLSRPLFLYLASNASPQSRAFVEWVGSRAGQHWVEREGFCPARGSVR